MKHVYGIKSIVATACISFFVIIAAYFIISHRYVWALFVVGVLIDFIRTNANRYHFTVVKEGSVEFKSLNPFREKVIVPAARGTSITVTAANSYSYQLYLSAANGSSLLRLSMHVSELRKLVQLLSVSGCAVKVKGASLPGLSSKTISV